MKISYKWLQSYFEQPLPTPEELADLFNARAFEVESIEKMEGGENTGSSGSAFKISRSDEVLDIKTLADRNHYALSHRGIAGEAAVIIGQKVHDGVAVLLSTNPIKADPSVEKVSVNVETLKNDPTLCPRYVARFIENVTVTDSPQWLKDYLISIGARSINSIVDSTNINMFDVGQPLHAFDADKVKGEIHIRKAKVDEKIIILDGSEISLSENDLVIADDEGPIAIAGVKGGKRAEVSLSTKNIIIESANFNPTSVRRTSTRLNLRNDSSKRFENEITPDLAGEVMERITLLIRELCPESKIGEVTDIYPNPAKSWNVEVTTAFINSSIGLDIPKETVIDILTKLGCCVVSSVNESGEGSVTGVELLTVTPPLNRLDLKIPADIVDEVARIYGYEKLPSVLPPELLQPTPFDQTFLYGEKVKNILVTLGFSEVLVYTLVAKGIYEISYPLASDKSALRESITQKLSETLITNGRNADLLSLDAIKIFEIGRVFKAEGENVSLCMGALQIKKQKGVSSESVLKNDIEVLEKEIGVSFSEIDASAKITTGEYGAIFEINFDKVVSFLGTKKLEVNLSDLGFTSLPQDKKYKIFSTYPFAVRDIAVFVPVDVSKDEIYTVIKKEAGELLVADRLFDVFTKKNPDGTEQTSYAYRLVFQSFEKTLTDEEINEIMSRITNDLNAHSAWLVR